MKGGGEDGINKKPLTAPTKTPEKAPIPDMAIGLKHANANPDGLTQVLLSLNGSYPPSSW